MRDHLIELLNSEPFAPFRIVLSSGEGHEIRNPNLVAMGESLMHIFLPKSDRYVTLRLNQIASAEILEPAA
jgi:hypothetical protein